MCGLTLKIIPFFYSDIQLPIILTGVLDEVHGFESRSTSLLTQLVSTCRPNPVLDKKRMSDDPS